MSSADTTLDNPADVAHLSCIPCLKQGFRCSAYRVEAEGPLCIYHVDGEICPHRNAPTVSLPAPAPIKALASSVPKPAPVVTKPATQSTPKEKPAMVDPDAPKCKYGPCNVRTNSKTGFCPKHYYLSVTKNQGEPSKCDLCGATLRRDNKTRLCKKHRNQAAEKSARTATVKAPALRTSGLAKPARTNGNGHAIELTASRTERINLSLSERQLVQLFTQLPLESKAALMNHHFELETTL